MLGNSFTVKLLSIALGYALVVGLLPISNYMVSMQAMRMDAASTSQTSVSQNNPAKNAGGGSAGPCCDGIGSFSLTCAFIVPQSSCVTINGGSERVGYSTPLIQSIYIEAVIQPPKA